MSNKTLRRTLTATVASVTLLGTGLFAASSSFAVDADLAKADQGYVCDFSKPVMAKVYWEVFPKINQRVEELKKINGDNVEIKANLQAVAEVAPEGIVINDNGGSKTEPSYIKGIKLTAEKFENTLSIDTKDRKLKLKEDADPIDFFKSSSGVFKNPVLVYNINDESTVSADARSEFDGISQGSLTNDKDTFATLGKARALVQKNDCIYTLNQGGSTKLTDPAKKLFGPLFDDSGKPSTANLVADVEFAKVEDRVIDPKDLVKPVCEDGKIRKLEFQTYEGADKGLIKYGFADVTEDGKFLKLDTPVALEGHVVADKDGKFKTDYLGFMFDSEAVAAELGKVYFPGKEDTAVVKIDDLWESCPVPGKPVEKTENDEKKPVVNEGAGTGVAAPVTTDEAKSPAVADKAESVEKDAAAKKAEAKKAEAKKAAAKKAEAKKAAAKKVAQAKSFPLAKTGADAATVGLIAVLAIAAGAGIIVARRRFQ